MIILGVETTCDETGLALVEVRGDSFRILTNMVASQETVHQPYGGVVPILAAREHEHNLPLLYRQSLDLAKIKEIDIDLIACAHTPGLPPALLAGKRFVVPLAERLVKPLVPINHLWGHLYTPLIRQTKDWQNFNLPALPSLGLVISGGHTLMLLMKSLNDFKVIGRTLDDAIGESFDKVARLLGLAYPGGPNLERLAKQGQPTFSLPRPLQQQPGYNCSFSGLKTALSELVQSLGGADNLSPQTRANLAASFQKAATETLLNKVRAALHKHQVSSIIIGGGVSANQYLIAALRSITNLPCLVAPLSLATDSGLQIALPAAYAIINNCLLTVPINQFDIVPTYRPSI